MQNLFTLQTQNICSRGNICMGSKINVLVMSGCAMGQCQVHYSTKGYPATNWYPVVQLEIPIHQCCKGLSLEFPNQYTQTLEFYLNRKYWNSYGFSQWLLMESPVHAVGVVISLKLYTLSA